MKGCAFKLLKCTSLSVLRGIKIVYFKLCVANIYKKYQHDVAWQYVYL